MTYRKVGIIGLIIVFSLLCVQRIYVHQKIEHFSKEEQFIKEDWKKREHPVMCPHSLSNFCTLEAKLTYFNDEKEKEIAFYEAQFNFLCFLSLPFFICLFIKKKQKR